MSPVENHGRWTQYTAGLWLPLVKFMKRYIGVFVVRLGIRYANYSEDIRVFSSVSLYLIDWIDTIESLIECLLPIQVMNFIFTAHY